MCSQDISGENEQFKEFGHSCKGFNDLPEAEKNKLREELKDMIVPTPAEIIEKFKEWANEILTHSKS